MTDRVRPDSLVTLHYRVTTSDGSELISTFGTTPATLQLGNGELAPPLEVCLAGLPVGERHVFMREPADAFGAHNPALVKRLLLEELPNDGADLAPHAVIEFTAPSEIGRAHV